MNHSPTFIDLTGQKFGRLKVIQYLHTLEGRAIWFCKCDCGNEKIASGKLLRNGKVRSCGCLLKEKVIAQNKKRGHEHRHTHAYAVYRPMLSRCYNPNATHYKHYGGRGIAVCDRWRGKEGFPNFFADMGECPEKHSIERIDNNGNYCPENCKWATNAEQAMNKRDNHLVAYKGEMICIAEAARRSGINRRTILDRLRRGWTEEEAVSIPSGMKRK